MAARTKRLRSRQSAGAPTTPQRQPIGRLRVARIGRQIIVGALCLFVLLGVLGIFGSKTSGVTAAGGGYVLSVVYPKVTRPGLPVRWTYAVTHHGGFDGKIQIATTFEYLNFFDLTNIQPDASEQTADPSQVLWTFDPPSGDVFTVEFDAATESGIHDIPVATASVVKDGIPVVQVRFKTVSVP